MNLPLTEKQIRDRANAQSFQRGQAYYKSGAIYNPALQATPSGVALTAQCEGSSAPSYRLHVEVDGGGVRLAACTCPYDWGGDCKHIVALLLMYVHQPDEFSEQKSMNDLLAGLEKDALIALILRLVERDPDLYDVLELAIPMAKITTTSDATRKRQTQVSEETYRKQVNRILKQAYRGDYYDERGSTPGYVEDLGSILETGMKFLDAGDAEGALIILRVLLEELTEDYDSEMDYDGDLACVIQDIGMPLVEAILSAELEPGARQELEGSVQNILDDLDQMIEAEDKLELILAALEYGWDELPDEETKWEEYDEEYWMVLDELKQARLNVLARRGDDETFLKSAERSDAKRYTLKLIELGRLDEAVEASEKLGDTSDAFTVAQKLREAGRLNDAIALAEKGLEVGGYYLNQLALWLAPLEESQGRTDMALKAYRTAYAESPNIAVYRKIKQLTGKEWEKDRPVLIQKASERHFQEVVVDIHLEEKDWDAAIKVAEQDRWSFRLLEKVADAVISHRPDWVIRVSLKQSDELIAKTQSKLYPIAARWLERAKDTYQQKGQDAEWQAYIDNLRMTYARRPALQRELKEL
ncbi:MAG TPA: SWIM zinc finger family protein [Anaerolineales bacterium]|nr:SWIM zinc finger family protein [Anaerolineales bacterium]